MAEHCRAPAPPRKPPRRQARRHSGYSQGKGSHAHNLLPSAGPQCGFGWWKTLLQPSHPVSPRRSCEQRYPIHDSLASSRQNLVFGAFFSQKHFCSEDACKSSEQKVPSHSCFLAPAQGSTGCLTSPVIHGETIIEQYQRTAWLPASQSRKDITAPGKEGEGWWASCLRGGWGKTKKQAGAGEGSPGELHSPPEPMASSHAAPGIQPRSPQSLHCKRISEAGASLQMALGRNNAEGSVPAGGLGHICHLAPWHQALGLGEPAGTPGRGISASTQHRLGNPPDQGSHRRCGEQCGTLTPAEPTGLGAGWHFCSHAQGPRLPGKPTLGPQLSMAPGCGQDGGAVAGWELCTDWDGAAETIAGWAVPPWVFGEKWGVMAPHTPRWGSNGSCHPSAPPPLSKIMTPKPASSSERHVWESQPPRCPCHSSPAATRRTVGRDGALPPPSWGYVAPSAPCSPVAHAPAAPVSARASLCRVRSQQPSRPLASGYPGCPYG